MLVGSDIPLRIRSSISTKTYQVVVHYICFIDELALKDRLVSLVRLPDVLTEVRVFLMTDLTFQLKLHVGLR